MALETLKGRLQLTRLTEPAEYVARRDELRLVEIELMRQHERVAAMRRRLPPGAIVEDYAFQEGPPNLDAGDVPVKTVRLSELFTGSDRSLSITSCTGSVRPIPAHVHDVDRRLQRRQRSSRAERRLCHRCGR